ncbi:Retrovirus-related Pol polyprotein from transposon RE2 [Vitis vinifera]|uniref:Retrovirus-related Pol polyprotein from transposon RE2 n=2 Tax=Vitis vinifera TaxID=29760 RepID=A0A438D5T3_VITVI|nr:Retrovirus-related Pol polyprotein from transposon RE2 [Vitis vinifera]
MSLSLKTPPFFSTSESLPVSEVLPLPIISLPDAVPSHPLQVYHRCHRVVVPPSLADRYLLTYFLSLRLLLPRLCLLLLTYPLLFEKSTPEALSHPGWRQTMVDEMAALHSNGNLGSYCFTLWDLAEEFYMKQPLGFVAQKESGLVCKLRRSLYGLKQSRRALYALDILEETGMLDCKPVDTPITPSQSVLYENRGHTQVVGYTDADWAGSPTDRRSTSGYCVFIGGNLISWKSKKQDVVARSSAEAKYRAMALATCELIWLKHLLRELRFGKDEQMKLICDNQATLHIASNPVFHERTKHIEVNCHFIREKIALGCVATSFVNSNDQLADIFTKSLRGLRIKYICNKLGAYNIYAPA